MKRPAFAGVLVTLALLAPAAGAAPTLPPTTAPVLATASPGLSVATPRVTPAPDAPAVDRCASRSKKVTQLKRRLRTAKTKRGKARTRRLLAAARRSLKRCRAQGSTPRPTNPTPAPGPAPAPAPGPGPTAPPGPSPDPGTPPAPEPGVSGLTVNGGASVISSAADLQLVASNLAALPQGSGFVYHFGVRTPVGGPPQQGCQRRYPAVGGPVATFSGTSGTASLPAAPPWCIGLARAFVWAGLPSEEYPGTTADVATVSFTVVAAAR